MVLAALSISIQEICCHPKPVMNFIKYTHSFERTTNKMYKMNGVFPDGTHQCPGTELFRTHRNENASKEQKCIYNKIQYVNEMNTHALPMNVC